MKTRYYRIVEFLHLGILMTVYSYYSPPKFKITTVIFLGDLHIKQQK